MSVKRSANIQHEKACNCLKCDRKLKNLEDNIVNTCEYCGQQHLVDIYEGKRIVLTVAEKPELRRRLSEEVLKDPEREKKQAEFNKRLAEFRRKWRV